MTETVTIEKQVWESTLNRSMKLQAENETLKDLLEECREEITGNFESFINIIADGETADLIRRIDEVLNAK